MSKDIHVDVERYEILLEALKSLEIEVQEIKPLTGC